MNRAISVSIIMCAALILCFGTAGLAQGTANILEDVANLAKEMADEANRDYVYDGTAKFPARSNWFPADVYAKCGYKDYPAYTSGYPLLPRHMIEYADKLGLSKAADPMDPQPGEIIVWPKHMGIYVGKNDKGDKLVAYPSAKLKGAIRVYPVKYIYPKITPYYISPDPNAMMSMADDIATDEKGLIVGTAGYDRDFTGKTPPPWHGMPTPTERELAEKEMKMKEMHKEGSESKHHDEGSESKHEEGSESKHHDEGSESKHEEGSDHK